MPVAASKFGSKEGLLVLLPSLLLIAAAFWVAAQFIKPAPPDHIVIATGSETGAYHGFAKLYREILAESEITLELRPTAGSVENIRLLMDPKSGVDLALVQGRIASAQTASSVVSLGRVFMEPVWVFYRSPEPLERLTQLKGRRIAIGPEGSGTRQLAELILKPSGVDASSASLIGLGGNEAADCLRRGACDALFLVASPKAKVVKDLLNHDGIDLMSFAQGEALSRIFPFLTGVVLPEGVADFVRNIPNQDKTLVAAQAGLLARSDIHPALIGLLVNAAKRVHKTGGLFQRTGEYPKQTDPEFPMSDAAEIAYNSGVPLLQQFLPFWLAIFIERMIVFILPIATILLPLMKFGPWLYTWRVRRPLLHWYAQLKELERRISADPDRIDLVQHRKDIKEIDEAVSVITVPVRFSDQFYELRAAVDLVRQRLSA